MSCSIMYDFRQYMHAWNGRGLSQEKEKVYVIGTDRADVSLSVHMLRIVGFLISGVVD
jgi:hypothetical protein